MDKFSLANPLFAAYAIAASVMILKVIAMAWLTVVRMTQERGGFRAPEDVKRTPLNPEPNPQQLAPNEFLYFATDQYVYGLIPFGPELSLIHI